MNHFTFRMNLGLIFMRQVALQNTYSHFGVSRVLVDNRTFYSNKGIMNFAPLYLYDEAYKKKSKGELDFSDQPSSGRSPNLSPAFIKDYADRLGLTFIPEGKGDRIQSFGPEDVFDYMYAVFHSPTYRDRYAEFLKIDFPRLPLTSNIELFRSLCEIGGRLAALHLMETAIPLVTSYPIAGNNTVEAVRYSAPGEGSEMGRVWINKMQYFECVPPEVWAFQIGGYQVCQKWLKDRKGRLLTYDDMTHYRRIVAVLAETIRLMAGVDEAIAAHGGWPIG